MSNIVILEHDYTSAGNPRYNNFGVVVPGFVINDYATFIEEAESKGLTLDDNGVIEFRLASDFAEVVGLGLKKYKGKIVAVAPTVEMLPEGKYVPDDYAEYAGLKAAYANDGKMYGFAVYDKTSAKAEEIKIGELVGASLVKYHINDDGYYYEYIDAGKEIDIPESAGTLVDGKTYTLYTKFTEFVCDSEDAYEAAIISARSKPVLILNVNKGQDEEETEDEDIYSFGNQYAYELLNLGYPVLYKILNKINYDEQQFINGEIEDLTADAFWSPLTDRSVYDFRYLISGILENNTEINNQMCKVASKLSADSEGRGDVIALCDIRKDGYIDTAAAQTQIQVAKKIADCANEISLADKFSGLFAPTVEYAYSNSNFKFENDTINDEFSGAFHYLMCAANSVQNNFSEWYANSGYNRGIGKYTVIGTPGVKLGDQAVKYLQPRVITKNTNKAVNLIIKIRDNYYLWGNRTAAPLDNTGLKASHFLNIRQLCATLNKQIYATCKRFTFDPNSDVLWINFKNAIRPTLEAMKANQGIDDYNFELLPSTQKAELRARVKIVPIEAVEDFYIGIALVDSISETTVTITEA